MAKTKKKTKTESTKKIRTKEVWLQSLEDIATDSSRDPHARLGALRQIGEMMGFKDSHNFEKLGTEERVRMAKTVVAPVLETVFGIEIDDDITFTVK
jgi:hypothetical protein